MHLGNSPPLDESAFTPPLLPPHEDHQGYHLSLLLSAEIDRNETVQLAVTLPGQRRKVTCASVAAAFCTREGDGDGVVDEAAAGLSALGYLCHSGLAWAVVEWCVAKEAWVVAVNVRVGEHGLVLQRGSPLLEQTTPPAKRMINRNVNTLMRWLFFAVVDAPNANLLSADELSDCSRGYTPNKPLVESPRELKLTLRPYQRAAVAWMLSRERVTVDAAAAKMMDESQPHCRLGDFAQTWVPIRSPGGGDVRCYYSAATGSLADHQPQTAIDNGGGIVADEMGLGKSAEVLATVLLNRRASPSESPAPSEPLRMMMDSSEDGEDAALVSFWCVCGAEQRSNVCFTCAELGGMIQCCQCGIFQHRACVVLAADGADKSPPRRHVCASCACECEPGSVHSGTTLIVTPPAISCQWEREISRLVRTNVGFKVLIYTGAKAIEADLGRAQRREQCRKKKKASSTTAHDRPSTTSVTGVSVPRWMSAGDGDADCRSAVGTPASGGVRLPAWMVPTAAPASPSRKIASQPVIHYSHGSSLNPHELAKYDIVLTTFDTLRAELHRDMSGGGERRCRRLSERYRTAPSPLSCIAWWRVVCDEAQMVESGTTAAAKMLLRLHTANRWCVSGTPFVKSTDDLYGLVAFLEVLPFADRAWWRFLSRSATPLRGLIAQIMWRTQKKDVMDQIGLPSVTEREHSVEFSSIERYFYERQSEKVKELIRQCQSPAAQGGGAPWNHLLRLRQACCHPQIGSFGVRRSTAGTSAAVGGGNVGGVRRRGRKRRRDSTGAAGRQLVANCQIMSMPELLQQMLDKARLDCEEAQRKLVFHIHALAGFDFMMDGKEPSAGHIDRAIEHYRFVLDIQREHQGTFDLDTLQLIHAQHNLARALDKKLLGIEWPADGGGGDDGGVGAGSEQEELQRNAEKLKVQYLVQYLSDWTRSKELFRACRFEEGQERISRAVARHPHRLALVAAGNRSWQCDKRGEMCTRTSMRRTAAPRYNCSEGCDYDECAGCSSEEAGEAWWTQGLKLLEQNCDEQATIAAINSALVARVSHAKSGTGYGEMSRLHGTFSSLAGLRLVLKTELDKLKEKRSAAFEGVRALMDLPTADQASVSGKCNTCRKLGGIECDNCNARAVLKEYENRAFSFFDAHGRVQGGGMSDATWSRRRRRNGAEEGGETSYQYRLASEVSVVLAAIGAALRSLSGLNAVPEWLFEFQTKHCAILQLDGGAIAKEIRKMHDFLTARHELLSAKDELDMCTGRQRLAEGKFDKKNNPETEDPLCVFEFEIAELRQKNVLEKTTEEADLSKFKSRHSYLRNLQNQEAGGGPQECGVCYQEMGETAFLPCAHRFCRSCVDELEKMAGHSIKCPLCKAVCRPHAVKTVIDKSQNDGSRRSDGLGDAARKAYGTKLGAVVGTLLSIRRDTPDAKILIFSMWEEVLDIVSAALTHSAVRFSRIQGRNNFQHAVDSFKGDPKTAALLLPVKTGSNGLNLTEAQHVFLLEPLLNLGMERQAIGRVHRIGQTRRTFVHRFHVADTVETRIRERKEKNDDGPAAKGERIPFKDIVDLVNMKT